ncbi:putative ABC transporter ATP-binding protein [Porphyridium purpureum]|uniref:Probable ATP-dependent transporter ycf16 n=1 Tax=Porphyridium purpureum TaxID=35688 RepID=A0A5J4Z340_PORPP|nr:putative ABC transporter ATP-binding protein [Porphyridium purpureum]|eukprot:POR1423..scf295_1
MDAPSAFAFWTCAPSWNNVSALSHPRSQTVRQKRTDIRVRDRAVLWRGNTGRQGSRPATISASSSASLASRERDGENLERDSAQDKTRATQMLARLVREIKVLGREFWTGPSAKTAWTWTILTVVFAFLNTVYAVGISFLQRAFWSALSAKDTTKFAKFLKFYVVAIVVGPVVITLYDYMRAKLSLLWRDFLTRSILKSYMSGLAYYKVNSAPTENGYGIDNPDQRITEDVRAVTSQAVELICTVSVAFFDFVLFSIILFRIYPPLFATLLVYSAVGTAVIVYFGRRLVDINAKQLQKEADFRYGLVRVRENAESVAFYHGDAVEQANILSHFGKAFKNNLLLISFQRNLGFFSSSFKYWINVVPSLVIAPIYFKGAMPLGYISQTYFSFFHVLSDLGLIVEKFSSLSTFSAGVNRLHDFRVAIDQLHQQGEHEKETGTLIELTEVSDARAESEPALQIFSLTIEPPGSVKKELVRDLSLSLEKGERLLVSGESGIGKSSLMRVIAGLWNHGSGSVQRAQLNDCMFLSQKPYLTLGLIKENACYPLPEDKFTDEQVREALERVNLSGIDKRLGRLTAQNSTDLSSILSLGEQQRLAFARILLNRPKFVILDESTSALDGRNEQIMYKLMVESGATIVSVSNRPNLEQYHSKLLQLSAHGKWEFRSKGLF